MALKPTTHLNKRRKRIGLGKKGYQTFLARAFEQGLRLEDIKHKTKLYTYVKGITKDGYYPILYNYYIIIVSEVTDIGITILRLPRQYYKSYQQVKGGNNNGQKYSDCSP